MATEEIDPQLFITCRLCLKETGSFQIKPDVLEDIKFCFDIVFELFDGLSQVICKGCMNILTEFTKTKKEFRKNHENLLKIKNKNVIVEALKKTEVSNKVTAHTNVIKQYTNKSDKNSNSNGDKRKSKEDGQEEWKDGFQEYYVCRYCEQQCTSLVSIKSHLKTHTSLISHCNSLISKHCNVSLNRIDDLPNITGKLKIVQLTPQTLVLNENKNNYYVTYLSNEKNCKEISHSSSPIAKKRESYNETSDSLSEEDKVSFNSKKQRTHKRIRLLSSSSEECGRNSRMTDKSKSNEDEKSKTPEYNAASCSKEKVVNVNENNNSKDCLEIKKDTCDSDMLSQVLAIYNKCVKNLDLPKAKPDKSTLNCKVLSIGTKIMSKEGITSTGLLKYLEHNNLSISWKPNTPNKASRKEIDLIRIMPRVKEKPEIEDTYECISNADVKIYSKPCTILNANLVPNPRPIKKLLIVPIVEEKTLKTNSVIESSEPICLHDSDDDDDVSFVPAVNGGCSQKENSMLASILAKPSDFPSTSNSIDKPITTKSTELPRIKCKPVSELMSTEALSYLGQVNGEIATPNAIEEPSLGQPSLQPDSNVAPVTMPANTGGYMTLDDVTNSRSLPPFELFESLLSKYNIVLLSSNTPLNSKFNKMIKFKLNIKQTDKSILLSLSLWGTGNMFCIKVQSKTKEVINISKMTASWQWEVMKSFQDANVIAKVKEFSKNINSEETEQFLRILKLIHKP